MSLAPDVQFNEADHIYYVDGLKRPSVTQVIHGSGLVDDEWWTDEAKNRGRAVHAATQYSDEGNLDEATLAEEYRPYLRAWRSFLESSRATITRVEQRVFHPIWGYCGTLDRTMEFDGGTRALVDIKSRRERGTAEPWWRVQLMAYLKALEAGGVNTHGYRILNVVLHADGSYAVVAECTFPEQRDAWNTFLACLTLWNFKEGRKR